jgi:hypothetical protein
MNIAPPPPQESARGMFLAPILRDYLGAFDAKAEAATVIDAN